MGRTGGVVVGRKGSPHRSLFGEICNADEKEGWMRCKSGGRMQDMHAWRLGFLFSFSGWLVIVLELLELRKGDGKILHSTLISCDID